MSGQLLRIKAIRHVTHDVLQMETEKPGGLTFIPGQAADISIHKDSWKDEIRPFTFTSLPEDDFLQFTIKTYPQHNGVTNELLQLKPGDQLILHGVFGAISYKGEGTFIAGGAGITPFIAIFRHLSSRNAIGNSKLIFANKKEEDIILKDEFEKMLGQNFINILSDEELDGYAHGFINEHFFLMNLLDLKKNFYVCGPPPFMDVVLKILNNLKVEETLITMEAE
jgi:ferredoxin-NADP reductase